MSLGLCFTVTNEPVIQQKGNHNKYFIKLTQLLDSCGFAIRVETTVVPENIGVSSISIHIVVLSLSAIHECLAHGLGH